MPNILKKYVKYFFELIFILALSFAIKHDGGWGSLITFGTGVVVYSFLLLFLTKKAAFLSTFALLVLFSISSFVKTELLGIPVQLYDLKMLTQLFQVDGFSDFSQFWEVHEVRLTLFYAIIVLLLYWGGEHFIPKQRKSFSRVILSIFFGILVICISSFQVVPNKFDKMHNLRSHGAFGIIYSQLYKSVSCEPANYSDRIVEQFVVEKKNTPLPEPLPNIVVLLLESTVDTSKLENISVEPHVRNLFDEIKEKSLHGRLFAPGGTANAEYELLTSLSIKSLPTPSIPYMEISRNTLGLPVFFTELEYKCIAYHMGIRSFYNRNTVFNKMGFNHYMSKADFKHKRLYVKNFYRDKEMFDEIISTLAIAKHPVFAHALTIVPHHPYDEENPEFKFTVSSSSSEAENKRLSRYFSRIEHTRDEISEFLNKLDSLSRRTIVLMYSDHLPPLASMSSVGAASLFYALYDTKRILPTGEGEDLKTYELATFLLQSTKFPLRGIDRVVMEDKEGEKMKLVHYDMLYGKQYLSKLYSLKLQ